MRQLDDADLEPRELFEHVVEDQRRERHLDPVTHGHAMMCESASK
jgi:hypothetical protein